MTTVLGVSVFPRNGMTFVARVIGSERRRNVAAW